MGHFRCCGAHEEEEHRDDCPRRNRAIRPNIFQSGRFFLSSGQESNFKIDCDALTNADIQTVAMLLKDRLPAFGSVEGVPTGGLRLADAMKQYVTTGLPLIVDDVWTTGSSIWKVRGDREALGAVIFARYEVQSWVTPLFMMGSGRIRGNKE